MAIYKTGLGCELRTKERKYSKWAEGLEPRAAAWRVQHVDHAARLPSYLSAGGACYKNARHQREKEREREPVGVREYRV